ncbi:MAG: hypothetical protein LBK75_11195, partial [Oscillospiraceae bacterium]|nr:hypothetical protein [Oscillospiraceae bacterium]
MAVVKPGSRMSVRIDKWLGLNLSPDGDTGLRHGEAAVMRNFRVTADGNLRTRPGYAALQTLQPGRRVDALWGGSADGRDVMTALIGGRILEVAAGAGYSVLGTGYGAYAHFFGFGGKVYCLTGSQYLVWSGTRGDVFAPVVGYAPIVTTATPPAGGGTPLESVNLLTPQRRQRFSPDGTATLYKLLDAGIQSVDRVTDGGAVVPTAGYTVNLTAGTVTFGTAPAGGVPNSVEITYTAAAAPDPVLAQRYSAVFGGATDARVWLYGDGGARVYHSGLDEFGVPTAEYFPVDGEMLVDVDNKPVTGMV